MKIDVLLGLQWGDEGKGKIVDVLTPDYQIIARFQGGPNAGHTIEFDNKKFILHTIPSGIFSTDTINIIGNGVIIDPYIISKELQNLEKNGVDTSGNLFVSKKAHLILPTHRMLDAVYENNKGNARIGSTLKGIGPAYTDKYGREGIRVGEISNPSFRDRYESLKEKHLKIIGMYDFDTGDQKFDGLDFNTYEEAWFVGVEELKKLAQIDSEYFINDALDNGKRVLAEGAQGTMLDVDFGSYPFVTSSNTITAGVCSGLGVAPSRIGEVFGVFKAYCTRVGGGPFPTELTGEEGDMLRDRGAEFGSTTGRPRRCGWLDLTALKYSIMLNGVSRLFMMKTDVLSNFDNLYISKNYKDQGQLFDHVPFNFLDIELEPDYEHLKGWKQDINNITEPSGLPGELINYIEYVEKETGVPVKIVSVGPDRKQTIMR